MKTIEQVLADRKTGCFDGRDVARLARFLTEEQLEQLGIEIDAGHKGKHVPVPMTEQAVLEILRMDVAFGFEKALNKRGLSAGLMFEVVRMWNYVLENELADWYEERYAMYGLPLFKATALLYGFDNPIGSDTGSEDKYRS